MPWEGYSLLTKTEQLTLFDLATTEAKVGEKTKHCTKCSSTLPLSCFPLANGIATTPYCKPCLKDYNAILKDLKKKHKVPQDHSCEICGKSETELRKTNSTNSVWRLDHDHETGAFRGFLCSKCNLALGHFLDSVELLDKAKDYLNRTSGYS